MKDVISYDTFQKEKEEKDIYKENKISRYHTSQLPLQPKKKIYRKKKRTTTTSHHHTLPPAVCHAFDLVVSGNTLLVVDHTAVVVGHRIHPHHLASCHVHCSSIAAAAAGHCFHHNTHCRNRTLVVDVAAVVGHTHCHYQRRNPVAVVVVDVPAKNENSCDAVSRACDRNLLYRHRQSRNPHQIGQHGCR